MDLHIQNDIPTRFPDNTYVSIDTEFFGQQKNKLHRPHGKFGIMTICAAPYFVYYITKTEEIPLALERLDNCVWVMQNAKYDLTQLKPYVEIKPRTRLIDTMLIERILWNGYYDLFGLEHLGRRYLNEERPDKDYWQEWWQTHSELTPEAIQYSCQDASDQLRVWLEQKKILTKTDMKIWREIDQPALWAVLDFQGFRIDPEAWKQLAVLNKERAEEIKKTIPINAGSPKQVLAKLKELGFTGLQSTQEKFLLKAIKKYPKAKDAIAMTNKVLDFRMYSKRASTYGENFLKNMAEEIDGLFFVIADWNVTGAETGRMSASGGMQNIPIRETKEFRECFVARPGHKLVIADYDSQEARITGYLTQDKELIKIFQSGKKVYIVAAEKIFGKEGIKKGDPEYSKIKSTFLGMDYGMTEYGLSDREGISKAEAIGLIEDFFDLFSGVEKWVNQQRKNKKITYTVSGRKAYLNPYSSQCENNALNNPHQGTAADITKRSLGYIYYQWDENCFGEFGIVGVFHDELVADVPEEVAPQVRDFMVAMMVKAAEEICQGIPFKVDASVCDSWSEK